MAEVHTEYVEGQLFALFRAELELCKVREGEKVLVLHDGATRPDYVRASVGALESLGATVFSVHIPGVKRGDMPSAMQHAEQMEKVGDDVTGTAALFVGNTRNAEVVTALAPVVDMVVDLVRLQHAPGRVDVIKHGGRYLSVTERPDALARMFPTQDLKRRCLAAGELLDRASRLHVTSEAGTDVVADIAESTPLVEYGFVDEPARYDVWPGGFVAAFPRHGSANGTIVLDVGDMIFNFHKYIENPVRFQVEDSYITKVEGSGLDAKLVRDYLQGWNDPECYATSHMGFGLNERAQWNALQFFDKDSTNVQDGRAFYGNFLWSTGPTPQARRFVPGHFDIPMRDCTVRLDDLVVVDHGDIVVDELRYTGSSAAS